MFSLSMSILLSTQSVSESTGSFAGGGRPVAPLGDSNRLKTMWTGARVVDAN